MAFALPVSFEAIIEWAMSNALYLCLVGAVIYFGYNYLNIRTKIKVKPIDRGQIERVSFIERMKHNKNTKPKAFKYLKRGNQTIGKITHYTEGIIKANPHNRQIAKMLVKPLKTALKIPFGQLSPFVIDKENLRSVQENIDGSGFLQVPADTHFELAMGIYYDKQNEPTNRIAIIGDGILKTDFNNLASIYFAKAQEQATYDPERAHALALKEKEIQVEMAKRRGKLTSI